MVATDLSYCSLLYNISINCTEKTAFNNSYIAASHVHCHGYVCQSILYSKLAKKITKSAKKTHIKNEYFASTHKE
jgi:hypothetical protein